MARKSKPSFNLGQMNLFGEIAPAGLLPSLENPLTIPEGTPRALSRGHHPKQTTHSESQESGEKSITTNLFAGDTMSAEDFIKALEFDNWRINERKILNERR